jgi:ATP-dependent RNA helicase DDX23/PRP28
MMEEFVYQIMNQIPATNLKSHDEDETYKQELEEMQGFRKFRITQMFSATMQRSVEKVAKEYLRQPSFIQIGEYGGGNKDIVQNVEFVQEASKKRRLEDLLREGGFKPPMIIFMNAKRAVDILARALDGRGYKVLALHGGKSAQDRTRSFEEFKAGKHDILIATDAALRGEGKESKIGREMGTEWDIALMGSQWASACS